MERDLPTAPADISPAWLNRVLDGWSFPKIVDVDLERLGEADSLVGLVLRARLTFDHETDSPHSVVVKMPLAGAEHGPMVRSWYASEVGFYADLAESCGLSVPRALYSRIDEGTGDFVLVLEDFPGLTPGENERGATPAQAQAVMRMMAGLHARWWENSDLRDYAFLGNERSFMERVAGLLPERVPIFLDRFGDMIEPAERAVYEGLPARFATAVASLLDEPLTLIHRDLSLKNILVGGTPEDPLFVVIDWQRCSIGRGVRDVSFFIENSVHADWSEKFELLALYHDTLTQHGVRGYGWDRLLHDHRLSTLCDMAQGVAMGTTVPGPAAAGIIRNQLRGVRGAASQLRLLELLPT